MHSIDKSLLWLLSAGFRTRPSIFKAWGSFGSKTCESVALLHLVILQSEMLIDFQTGVRGGWIARSSFVCCFLTLMASFSNLALLISLPVPHTCHFSLLPSSFFLSLFLWTVLNLFLATVMVREWKEGQDVKLLRSVSAGSIRQLDLPTRIKQCI